MNSTLTNEKDFISNLLCLTNDNPKAFCLQDDIAKISENIILNTDTTIEGIHILQGLNAKYIAYKALARSYSDILAKNGKPIGYFLNIILPKNFGKINELISGFQEFVSIYKMDLLGGDTSVHNASNIIIVATILANVEKHTARFGAKLGDGIYLTKKVGSAYFGLFDCQNDDIHTQNAKEYLMPTLIRIEDYSTINASMDISDGLLADAEKMANASEKCFVIDFNKIPFAGLDNFQNMLSFGDDYNILVTSSSPVLNATHIGFVKEGNGLLLENFPFVLHQKGFDHFSG
jgi:thiamine-monophosphate kinase